MTDHTKRILRWVAVLPGAIAIGVGATFLIHWVLYFTLAEGETVSGVNIRPIEAAVSPTVMAFAFVAGGSEIAPARPVLVAGSLLGLWFALFWVLFLVMPSAEVHLGARGIGSLFGAVLGVFVARARAQRLTT